MRKLPVVGAYMDEGVPTRTPDTDIDYAAGIFLRDRLRRLPVVHEGRLVGAIKTFA